MDEILQQIVDIHIGKPELFQKPVNYVVAKNGIFVVKKTPFGEITVKADTIPMLEDIKEEFKLALPKVPYYIFLQAYSFFKDVCDRTKNEAALVLYFNKKQNKYELYCPEQEVTGASVKFAKDSEYVRRQTDPDFIRVCEMHSHNTMSAFHSGTDDKDEIFDCSFLVFGKLDSKPEFIFSFAASGKRVDSSLWDLFERPTIKIDDGSGNIIDIPSDPVFVKVDYPQEWHDRLKSPYHIKDYFDKKVYYGQYYWDYDSFDLDYYNDKSYYSSKIGSGRKDIKDNVISYPKKDTKVNENYDKFDDEFINETSEEIYEYLRRYYTRDDIENFVQFFIENGSELV